MFCNRVMKFGVFIYICIYVYAYIHGGTLCSHKKWWNHVICHKLYGTECYIDWNELEEKRHMGWIPFSMVEYQNNKNLGKQVEIHRLPWNLDYKTKNREVKKLNWVDQEAVE